MPARNASPRRFFAAKAEVGEEFVKLAQKKNVTLSSLLGSTMKKVVELDRLGVTIDDAFDTCLSLKTSREMGFVSIMGDLWYDLVETSLKTDRKETVARFGEAGKWIGKYVMDKFQSDDPLKHLSSYVKLLTGDEGEFYMAGGGTVHLRLVNSRFSQTYLEAFSELLSRALEALSFQTDSKTLSRGMLIATFNQASRVGKKVNSEIVA